ncbi:MAG: hypothetical protein JNK61_00610 [Bacteroidia bacterium]|nr:hypothetical protein [Bacteroidia bacterium]
MRIKAKSKINATGILRITSQTERSQLGNKTKAIEKFLNFLQKAITPKNKRIATKPTRASAAKRSDDKKLLSHKKKLRKSVAD